MSKLFKSKFLFGVMVVAVLVAGGLAFAGNANAATCTISSTVRIGSVGADVQCVQSIVGVTADGKFGPMTQAAVKAFQASKGLVADGVVGPMTRAAMMAAPQSPVSGNCQPGWLFNPATGQACTTTVPTPGNTGTLEGGAGDITISALSTYGDEEVGEGDEDVKVLAFEIEADDESDVEITSVKVEMNEQDSGNDEDLDQYVESVSVWMGSEKVGEDDADAFSESGDHVWTNSISLDGAVIEAGDTEKFYLAITALGNLDSGDIDNDDWQIGVSSVRFLDAEGVTSTESLTLDIDDNQVDDTLEEELDFATFATASDVELKVALNDDDTDVNEAHVINVDDADDTDGVELLSFTLEAEGSDINVTSIPVLFTTTETTGNDPDDLMSSASLFLDGEEIGTESFLTSDADDSVETLTFDDLDIDIDEGDTVEFMVKVDVQDTASSLDVGDTIMADLTATEVDAIEAEDETGEDLAAADLTGTANGEASAVYDIGFNIDVKSITESKTTGDPGTVGSTDRGSFVFKFDITAFDGDVSIDKSCVEDQVNAADQGTEYTVGNEASDSCTVTSTADTNANDADAWVVEDGQTESFTLTVTATAADAFVTAYMTSINWDDDITDTSPDLFSTFGLGQDETESGSLFLETY